MPSAAPTIDAPAGRRCELAGARTSREERFFVVLTRAEAEALLQGDAAAAGNGLAKIRTALEARS